MVSDAENIFDRELYLARLNRTKPNRPDILSHSIAAELAERLDPITREFNHACLIAVDPEPIAAAIRASGNWTWRLHPGHLDAPLAARLAELARTYGRVRSTSHARADDPHRER